MQLTAAVTWLMMYASVLSPAKVWHAPSHPLNVTNSHNAEVQLVLTDFLGVVQESATGVSTRLAAGATVDLKGVFSGLKNPGAYILYAVEPGKSTAEFLGTPLVVNVLQHRRAEQVPGVVAVKIEPLRFVRMETDKGKIDLAFYYDVAPHTAENFLRLAEQGYFDSLTFHRILPGFVIQGGDPRGDGLGGPGFQIGAEFNDRPHQAGVLSMARVGDPNEAVGRPPRPEFANSAGSQFFICLDYNKTRALDRKYTAFGKVTAGMDVVNAIAAVRLADTDAGRPQEPPVITKATVLPVTREQNPYATLFGGQKEEGK